MKMQSADIKMYPKLAYYVQHNLPQILNVPVISSAMQKIGQINSSRLRLALQWGHLPTIKIVPALGACGKFMPVAGSSDVQIDEGVVKDFERGKGVRVARAGSVYAVGVTLLHE